MPKIEMNNGQVHDITEPSTPSGCIRRLEAAASTTDGKGEAKQPEVSARFKDQDGDMVGIFVANVSSVY